MKQSKISRKPMKLCMALLVTWSMCITKSYGQMLPTSEGTPAAPLSPDEWQFMRHGGSMPNLYTGTVNVQIPIYTYKDNDFELPISLQYASNGYRPNDPQGIVGLDWSLSAGGMVTREIVGVPDDYEDSDYKSYGYYYYHSIPNNNESFLDRFHQLVGSSGKDVFMFKRNGNSYETAPDIFSFRCGAHSGKFVLGPSGKIHVFATNHPSGEYHVELKFIRTESTYSGFKSVVITTGDGYKYIFGNKTTELHGRHQSGVGSMPGYESCNVNEYSMAWPLVLIEAPNGRKAQFDYDATYITDKYNKKYYTVSVYSSCIPYIISTGILPTNDTLWYSCNFDAVCYANNVSSVGDEPKLFNMSYQALLKTIVIDSTRIEMSYIKREQQFFRDGYKKPHAGESSEYDTSEKYKMLDKRGLLSGITVKYNGRNSLDYKLVYRYNTPFYVNKEFNPIPFLQRVEMPDGGVYAMSYYQQDSLAPYYGTTRMDYAGYYNKVNWKTEKAYSIHTNVKQVTNPDAAMFGMLEQIIYPTGGYTTFEYEPHSYSRVLVRKDEYTGSFLVDIGNKDAMGAGLRIKTITDWVLRPTFIGEPTNVVVNEKTVNNRPCVVSQREYIYQKDGRSSGNCLTYARQLFASKVPQTAETRGGTLDIDKSCASFLRVKGVNTSYTVDKTGIEYRIVTEKRSDGSRKEYRFCSFDDLPDTMLFPLDTVGFWGGNKQDRKFIDAASRSTQRGKLLEVKGFTADGTLVNRQENIYSRDTLTCMFYMKPMRETYYVTYHYVDDYPFAERRTTEYIGADSICTRELLTYNTFDQISGRTTTLGDGSVVHENTYYASDPKSLSAEVQEAVKQQNLPGLILRQISVWRPKDRFQSKGDKRIRYDYKLTPSGHVKLGAIYTANDLKYGTSLANPEYMQEMTFDIYDAQGNIRQTTDRNGIKTSYVWGYGGRLLVAKVVNSDYLSLMMPNIMVGGLTTAQESSLRAISGAQVETYDYHPLLGLSKFTDAAGVVTQYEYYDSGKLKTVKDAEGNPIAEYDYSQK